MKAIFASLLSFLAVAVVSAQNDNTVPYYITAPLPGATFTAFQATTFTWLNGASEQITIDVIAGEVATAMQPTNHSITTDGSTGQYIWTIPEDLVSTTLLYALQFHFSVGGVAQSTFSAPFTVGPAVGAVIPTSAAPVTSAAPTATATATAVHSGSSILTAHSAVPTAHSSSGSAFLTAHSNTRLASGSHSASASASHSGLPHAVSGVSAQVTVATHSLAAPSLAATTVASTFGNSASALKISALLAGVPLVLALTF
ncbi:hypothetical protein BDF14DRAFT_1785490 [Spinellus fusiger]|nr:hypothetical protein BDF14DRAFT_1785490 [Spinellus fusiger]